MLMTNDGTVGGDPNVELRDTYIVFPFLENADENYNEWDVAVVGDVHLVKVEREGMCKERWEGLVNTEGRGCFGVCGDNWTVIMRYENYSLKESNTGVLSELDSKVSE